MPRNDYPILFSFRRCPYAIRARFALKYAGITCWMREVSLREKPQALINYSAKATVPVLVLSDGTVIDESLDIARWALAQNDPDNYLQLNVAQARDAEKLITDTDNRFTKLLHQFKYPESHQAVNRASATKNLHDHFQTFESRLQHHQFLVADHPSLADIASFPFVRQAARIDEAAFRTLPFKRLIAWLDFFFAHPAYQAAMKNFPLWHDGPGELF